MAASGRVAQEHVTGGGIFRHGRDTRARVVDAMAPLRLLVVQLLLLVEGAFVHGEDAALGVGDALPRQDRLLGGVHAADRRTVRIDLIARADALQPGDAARDGAVRQTPDDAFRRAGA